MWFRAGFVAALFAGLVPASAEDDGPPPYAPSIDYIDSLLMPANRQHQQSRILKPGSGGRVNHWASHIPAPGRDQKATASSNK
jgi:hypothetical protein